MVKCTEKAFNKCKFKEFCREPGTIVSEDSECGRYILKLEGIVQDYPTKKDGEPE